MAAHWRYKENRRKDDSIDHKVVWLRQLLEWKQELEESESLADALKTILSKRKGFMFSHPMAPWWIYRMDRLRLTLPMPSIPRWDIPPVAHG